MRGRRLLVVGVIVVVLLVAAAVVAYLVFGDDAPPRVSTEAAIAACQKVEPEVESLEDVDGVWSVVPPAEGAEVEDGSFVGYRVDEELRGIGANTAVGRTPDVTGDVEVEGDTVTAVTVEADLGGLTSDDSLRDGAVRNRALETESFPTATFVLGEPIALGSVPDDGEVVSQAVEGELTLHGTTQPVTIEVEAQRLGSVIVVIGNLDVVMADFGITPPQIGPVLGIQDHGEAEFQLCLTRAET